MKHRNILQCYGISFSLICSMVIISTEQYCTPPDVPVNGDYTPRRPKFDAGDKVSYTCNKGFFLMGVSKRPCRFSGQWDDDTPFCDQPATLNNPTLIGGNIPHNSISKLIDHNTDTCFVWERNTDRPLLLYLNEGVIVRAIRMFLKKGTTKLVIYTGVGNNTKVCANYGGYIETSQWVLIPCTGNVTLSNIIKIQSTDDRPSNISLCEIQAYVKDKFNCEKPPSSTVTNGYFEISRNRATLKCEEGYKPQNGRLICEENSWKGLRPKCEEILCDIVSRNDLNGKWTVVESVSKIIAGTKKKLECKTGYKVVGRPEIVTCLNDGTWTRSNATCSEDKSKSSRTIIFGAVGGAVAVIILILLGITICLVMRQKKREVVVVYKSTECGLPPCSETEYATVYYETIHPNVPASPRPPLLPPILSDSYSLPQDSTGTINRKPMPADIAFGTLKSSTLYGS